MALLLVIDQAWGGGKYNTNYSCMEGGGTGDCSLEGERGDAECL